MDTIWIESLLHNSARAPEPTTPEPPDTDEWPDEIFSDSLIPQDAVPGMPYDFKSPGQMDYFINELLSCMERTIIERMDCQEKFLDEIHIPQDVCPDIPRLFLKPWISSDILFVEVKTADTDGRKLTSLRFSQLGVDTASTLTKYTMETLPKKPLFNE